VHKRVNFIIATEDALRYNTQRVRKAAKFGIPTVSPRFLKACIKAGKLVDHATFIVVKPAKKAPAQQASTPSVSSPSLEAPSESLVSEEAVEGDEAVTEVETAAGEDKEMEAEAEEVEEAAEKEEMESLAQDLKCRKKRKRPSKKAKRPQSIPTFVRIDPTPKGTPGNFLTRALSKAGL
jgi:hypothetical protein